MEAEAGEVNILVRKMCNGIDALVKLAWPPIKRCPIARTWGLNVDRGHGWVPFHCLGDTLGCNLRRLWQKIWYKKVVICYPDNPPHDYWAVKKVPRFK